MYVQQWTDGSKPLRSKRVINHHSPPAKTICELPAQDNPPVLVTDTGVSLSDTLPTPFLGEKYTDPYDDPRETMYFKMAERDMISQTGRNPFFFNSSSYVDHISLQDRFLKPKSTILVDKSVANE